MPGQESRLLRSFARALSDFLFIIQLFLLFSDKFVLRFFFALPFCCSFGARVSLRASRASVNSVMYGCNALFFILHTGEEWERVERECILFSEAKTKAKCKTQARSQTSKSGWWTRILSRICSLARVSRDNRAQKLFSFLALIQFEVSLISAEKLINLSECSDEKGWLSTMCIISANSKVNRSLSDAGT